MPITDQQYTDWLNSDAPQRALLVEAKAYDVSAGAEVTHYLSTHPFVSLPADTPANQAYDDIIIEVPLFTQRIPEALGGSSQSGWGDIIVSNESGVRDDWLEDAWDGRALKLLVGDPSWPRDDFRTVVDGFSADIVSLDERRIALRARDKSWALNVPIQTSLIGGSSVNKDKLKPLCFGDCFNVEPVLTDAATHKYQVHDGITEDIPAVREGGNATAFTEQLADGTFTLTGSPTARITADVLGASTGPYLTTVADIVEHILTTRTILTSGDLDAAAFTAFDALCAQTVGLYLREGGLVASALDALVRAVGGYWTWTRDGLFTLGRLDAPSGTPVLELIADDIALNGIRIARRILPVKAERFGYRRNWTPQAETVGAVSEANRALYAAPYKTVTASNPAVPAVHLLADEPAEFPTLLQVEAEAQTEVNRDAALYSTLRYVHEVQCFAAPFQIYCGQVIRITHPTKLFADGRLVTVVGIRESPTRKKCVLEVFS
jgi:hypothetical protein